MSKNNISSYAGKIKENHYYESDIVIRECFLRGARNILDAGGIDDWAIWKLRGMIAFLEVYEELEKEIKNKT